MAESTQVSGRLWLLALPPLALAGGLGALELLRERFQRRQMFLPDRYPSGVWDPAPFGLRVEDCWFRAQDGVELHGWWVPQRRARGTLLYCHGNTGSLAAQVGTLQWLRRLRLDVFAFDYRGYGRSQGVPSERGLFRDVRAAFAHLTGTLGVPERKVILLGHSLGGAVAIDGAAELPAAGLVVQASFTQVRDMARARFPGLPLHLVARNHFRSIAKVGSIRAPKLFIHGAQDATVPLAMGQALFDAAADPKELFVLPQAGHNDIHLHGGLRYLVRLYRFCRRCLSAA